jgi:group I intron endonuclease
MSYDREMHQIYKATNTVNGKVYIGFTSATLKTRRYHHEYEAKGSRTNTHFHKAIRKYSPAAFKWEVIYESWDRQYCHEIIEPLLIQEHDAVNNGYNISIGGVDVAGREAKASALRRANPTIFSVVNINTNETFTGTSSQFVEKYKNCAGIYQVRDGTTHSFKGWVLDKGSETDLRKRHSSDSEVIVSSPSGETKIYKSIRDAAGALNVQPKSISAHACRSASRGKLAGYTITITKQPHQLRKQTLLEITYSCGKIDLIDGYNSASAKLDVSPATIKLFMRGGISGKQGKLKGITIRAVEDK